MVEKNIMAARAYYDAINNKDVAAAEKYLHADVVVTSPLDNLVGKEAVVKALSFFMPYVKNLTVRVACGGDDHVMLAVDVEYHEPIGMLKTVALMTFQDGLIVRNEIFFDARIFEKLKNSSR